MITLSQRRAEPAGWGCFMWEMWGVEVFYGGGLSRDLDAARLQNMQREPEGGTRAFMAKGTVCVKTDKRVCLMFPHEHGGLCGWRETSKGWGWRETWGQIT